MPTSYWLVRALLLRAVGFVYFVAFAILVFQARPLLGSEGLLPVGAFLEAAREHYGGAGAAFLRLPSLFWLSSSDGALAALSFTGLVLSIAMMAGLSNAPLLLLNWALYLSFTHVGQIFYGYGWDTLLCETGFLAVFLAPPWRPRELDPRSPPPLVVIVLLRWLLFRLMFGAGLIKIRGDECWRDLTCLVYHYETQPNPSPLSWYFHHLPRGVHQAGVLFNHFVELVVPFGVFGPRIVRLAACAFTIAFQVVLILSGNLSFLNWLTIVIALALLDDAALARLVPGRLRERLQQKLESLRESALVPGRARLIAVWGYAVVVMILSLDPIVNLLSERQRMNASFEPLNLVNTYGAFGSIGRERLEVVLEGTSAERIEAQTLWKEYEFPCKPGDVRRRPCLITPYHHRLSWQLWFAPFGDFRSQPWILNLVYKLLRGEPEPRSLLASDPFPDRPPRFIRARLYRYSFTSSRADGAWWQRELVGEYLQPLSLEHRDFRRYLAARGWLKD
ncbi:MAG TPA: lipase maturation factor family protein [Polyangiaceae bacterium]|nr:lipase maturation factor family protein [Polyangiaceae bacterium]